MAESSLNTPAKIDDMAEEYQHEDMLSLGHEEVQDIIKELESGNPTAPGGPLADFDQLVRDELGRLKPTEEAKPKPHGKGKDIRVLMSARAEEMASDSETEPVDEELDNKVVTFTCDSLPQPVPVKQESMEVERTPVRGKRIADFKEKRPALRGTRTSNNSNSPHWVYAAPKQSTKITFVEMHLRFSSEPFKQYKVVKRLNLRRPAPLVQLINKLHQRNLAFRLEVIQAYIQRMAVSDLFAEHCAHTGRLLNPKQLMAEAFYPSRGAEERMTMTEALMRPWLIALESDPCRLTPYPGLRVDVDVTGPKTPTLAIYRTLCADPELKSQLKSMTSGPFGPIAESATWVDKCIVDPYFGPLYARQGRHLFAHHGCIPARTRLQF